MIEKSQRKLLVFLVQQYFLFLLSKLFTHLLKFLLNLVQFLCAFQVCLLLALDCFKYLHKVIGWLVLCYSF